MEIHTYFNDQPAIGRKGTWLARATVAGRRIGRRGPTIEVAEQRLRDAIAAPPPPRPELRGVSPLSEPVREKRNGRRIDPKGYRVPRDVRRRGANVAEAACRVWAEARFERVYSGGNGPIDFLCVGHDNRIVLIEAKNAVNRDRLDEAQRRLVEAGALVFKHFGDGAFEVWAGDRLVEAAE